MLALRRDPDFTLLMVDAPLEMRFARAEARGRPGDGPTMTEFAARENRERGGNPLDQQIHLTMEMADARVVNAGSLGELHRQVDDFLERLGRRAGEAGGEG